MLEDDFTYVLRKALKGLALSPSEAAHRAQLPETEVLAFSRGHFSESTASRLAPVLGLQADAFSRHPDFNPQPVTDPSIVRLELPFGDDHVNAWLIRHSETSILFDTGDDETSCPQALAKLGISSLAALFITHHHPDHIAGISALAGVANSVHGPAGISGADAMAPGTSIRIGPLIVTSLDLSGHATPSNGYLVTGLAQPVLVSGDALFAGSIGGCPNPAAYQHALKRLRAELSTLSPDTVILPGHGPATTLAEEWEHNPFPIR